MRGTKQLRERTRARLGLYARAKCERIGLCDREDGLEQAGHEGKRCVTRGRDGMSRIAHVQSETDDSTFDKLLTNPYTFVAVGCLFVFHPRDVMYKP